MQQDRRPAVTARCDHCRKPIRAGRGVAGTGDTQFDSVPCRDAHVGALRLKGLQNGVRVARSRFKAGVISRAGAPTVTSAAEIGPWWSVCFDRSCKHSARFDRGSGGKTAFVCNLDPGLLIGSLSR
jgi:hypothetical protein